MAPRHSGETVNALGGRLRGDIAAVARDEETNPCKGRLMPRIYAHARRMKALASAEKKKRRVEKKRRICQRHFLSVQNHGPEGEAIFGGLIGIEAGGVVEFAQCTGHFVAACPEDGTSTIAGVIVFNIPGRGEIPCLCPTSLLDEAAKKVVDSLKHQQTDRKKEIWNRVLRPVTIDSVPVQRDNIHGHLLMECRRGLAGRVVDDAMLAALKAGSLQFGENTNEAVYTLDRAYSIDRNRLQDIGRVLAAEKGKGIRAFTANPREMEMMIHCGQSAIQSRLVYHRSLQKALKALNEAQSATEPSLTERLLQLSVGGDKDALLMGRFLPCQGLCDNPDISIRCACGFTTIDKKDRQHAKGLLRRSKLCVESCQA